MPKAKTLPPESFNELRSMMPRLSYEHVQDRAAFSFSFLAGMRVCEIAPLKLRDVTDANGEISRYLVVNREHTKTRWGARPIPMHPLLRVDLLALIELRGWQDGPLFWNSLGQPMLPDTLRKRFKEIFRRCGLKDCSSHSGRRSFATLAARRAANHKRSLRDVQALLGHAHLMTTAQYIDLAEDNSDFVDHLWDVEDPPTSQPTS